MRLIPNKLQRDVLRSHIGPFLFCFFTLMFLLLMQFLVLYINDLIGKGLPLGVVVELILTNLAYMVVLASPMATLVACLMAFGKLTEHNELTALRAAGVNPFRVMVPVLAASVLLCGFLVWFGNGLLPDANQKAKTLFIDIQMKQPSFELEEDQFYEGVEGYTFLVDEIESQEDSLYNITLYQEQTRRKNKAIIRAQKGQLQSNPDSQTATLMLRDGHVLRYLTRIDDGEPQEVLEKTNFHRYRISFDLSALAFSRSNPDDQARHERTMNMQSMRMVVDSLRDDIAQEKERLWQHTPFTSAEPQEPAESGEPAELDRASNDPSDTGFDIRGPTTRQGDSGSESAADRPRLLEVNLEASEQPPPVQSSYLVLNELDNATSQRNLRDMALNALRDYKGTYDNVIVNTDWRKTRVARYLVEIHKKLSIPVACIIFVLLGAPVGMYSRKGNLGYAALIGTVFLTFYWISIIQGEKLADRLFISPFWGMWFGNIVLGTIGLYLTLRVSTSFRLSRMVPERYRVPAGDLLPAGLMESFWKLLPGPAGSSSPPPPDERSSDD
ncbi:MAG: LptF/LptG family permease [Balneolaceae bacterium]|nr:LptF/LptG family permease [Balneolaceae bacterium]